jgi:hypothetical protein
MKKIFLLMTLCIYRLSLASDDLINNFRNIVKENVISRGDSQHSICKKKYNILGCLTGAVSDSIYEIQDILRQHGMALVYGDFLKGLDIIQIIEK